MRRTPGTLMAAGVAVLVCAVSAAAERPGPGRWAPDAVEDIGTETATHKEIEPLAIPFRNITALRLTAQGNLLATDSQERVIKVISPEGKQIAKVELPFGPEAIDVAPDGTLYCGGQGKLAKLDAKGTILETVDVPTNVASGTGPRMRGRGMPNRVSGIAVSDTAVFVAFGTGWSTGSKSKLFRFDRELGSPKLLAEGLRCCCQRCDIVCRDGVVYLAENTVHRVVQYDREGKVLGKWGQRSRTSLDGFGACCNPMNLCFVPDGTLYTSESGMGRVKRYTADGEFLGLVGYVSTTRFSRASGLAASCSNIAIAVTPDGARVYVMDYKARKIRVLEKKG